ncbi:hypothetical protein BO70DRAFT_392208 [Aspergillus heteromorphus CBS 117.55]|uniref:NTF2-like protein n=1 Tax=Aspergillus heteromorphus CBS 117.55 TaxID=1448321 RepID=A0A317X2I8_9EURO|nr:uncharacterized protein BO70DRAFT_392208 [Aspergillus heteromorphus CBS 117.55]PWY92829.1 hypothetical protein BO70DRAFT_392208 [Aspergillus heteromorphus CBS 117.55]
MPLIGTGIVDLSILLTVLPTENCLIDNFADQGTAASTFSANETLSGAPFPRAGSLDDILGMGRGKLLLALVALALLPPLMVWLRGEGWTGRTFWSPSTFPGCSTPMDYAESHATVMKSVSDLHIVRYDQAWAKDGHVLLRYTAEGSHCGEPYKGIQKSEPPKRARWSAAAIFEVEGGKIRSFVKDWDQKVMQIQLGWAPVTESEDPRWNREVLADPERGRKVEG